MHSCAYNNIIIITINSLSLILYIKAVSRNNAESVKFLLESGVDPTQKDIFGHTAMDNANSYDFENIANILDEYFKGLSLKIG